MDITRRKMIQAIGSTILLGAVPKFIPSLISFNLAENIHPLPGNVINRVGNIEIKNIFEAYFLPQLANNLFPNS